MSVTELSNLGDRAAIVRAPAGTVSTGGIYVLDGATFFDIVYLGGSAPADADLNGVGLEMYGQLP